jgi:glutamate formiminotransferase
VYINAGVVVVNSEVVGLAPALTAIGKDVSTYLDGSTDGPEYIQQHAGVLAV